MTYRHTPIYQNYIVLYCTVLYCTVLYCTVTSEWQVRGYSVCSRAICTPLCGRLETEIWISYISTFSLCNKVRPAFCFTEKYLSILVINQRDHKKNRADIQRGNMSTDRATFMFWDALHFVVSLQNLANLNPTQSRNWRKIKENAFKSLNISTSRVSPY